MTIRENKQLVHRLVEKVWNWHKIEKLSEFIGDELFTESTLNILSSSSPPSQTFTSPLRI